jgi:hypothetical protein
MTVRLSHGTYSYIRKTTILVISVIGFFLKESISQQPTIRSFDLLFQS